MTKEKAQEFKAVGNDHFKKGEYEQALEAFTNAIEQDPIDHVLYSNRSGTYVNLDMPELAVEDAEKCVSINGAWAKGYSRLGTALYKAERVDEAEKAFQEGLKIDPNNQALNDGILLCQTPPAFNMGDMMGGMGGLFGGMGGANGAGQGPVGGDMMKDILNDPEMMGLLEEDPQLLMTIMTKFSTIQSNPAEALKLLQDPNPKVRAIFTKVLTKMMGGGAAGGTGDMFGGMFGGNNNNAEAETEAPTLEPSFNSEPTVAAAQPTPVATESNVTVVEEVEEVSEFQRLKDLGNKAYKARDFETAISFYDQAYEASDKTELIVMSNKAAVYMEQKEWTKAEECIKHALDRRFDVRCSYEVAGKLMARMGSIFDKQKNYAQAVEWYEKSLVEDTVRKVRADLSKAKLALALKTKEDYYDNDKAEEARTSGNEMFKEGKYPEAMKFYDEGIKRNPNDARLFSNRAATFLKLFDPPNALRDVESALEIDPKFVRAYSRKGDAHMRMKENKKAMEAYQAGLNIDPNDASCKEGLQNVMYRIQADSMSNDVDPEQQTRAMQDPEIQAILADPQFRLMLQQSQENPSILEEAMKNPKFAEGINKLIAAGILKVG